MVNRFTWLRIAMALVAVVLLLLRYRTAGAMLLLITSILGIVEEIIKDKRRKEKP